MKVSEPFLAPSGQVHERANMPYRPAACLLGLPFDLIDLAEATARVQAEPPGGGAILSTPNVNWIMLARDHPWLRDSVLRSRLSVVDGTLLVWLGRLTGIPFAERVSGSDLFARLEHAPRPTRVFFFGGMADVAERASKALDPTQGTLHGVGGLNPGKGDLDTMSAPQLIEQVRTARPEMVVVALGALRGQAWVMRNHRALGATWVTHLGAVVNFVAGEIDRAPAWVGRIGMEWIWRIVEEPTLWKRYALDGLRLLGLIGTRVLPLLFWQRWYAPAAHVTPARWTRLGSSAAALEGHWAGNDARTLHQSLADLAAGSVEANLEIDLSRVQYLCPRVVGQLLVWHGYLLDAGRALTLVKPSPAARRLLHGYAADYLLAS